MTFGQFLAILRARWIVALAVLGVTVIATLAVSLLMPKKYTASASVLFDFRPDPLSAVAFGPMLAPALMATQVDVIKSERVAQRVVRNLKLAEQPAVREQWRQATDGAGSIEQWLAGVILKQMDVLPSRESSVLTITYGAPDPRFAAGLANAFAQAYVQTTLELRTNPAREFAGFFDQRAVEARDGLEKAQARLSEYQSRNGLIATDERLDIESARLAELSSQLVALQALSAESGSRQAQALGSRGDQMQEVLNNPVIGALKADLSRAQAKLQELQTRYGDAHPQVREAKANIGELRSRVDAETRRVTSGVAVTNSINRSRESQLRADLDAQRVKVMQMKRLRDEAAVIVRDVENAQRTYDAIVTRQNQSTLESQATQSNVSLLTQATPPLEPSSPRIMLNTLLAIFVGTLLGVGVALLLELRDRRVRTVEDVVTALGLPVIGVMPDPKARRRHTALTAPRAVPALHHPQGS